MAHLALVQHVAPNGDQIGRYLALRALMLAQQVHRIVLHSTVLLRQAVLRAAQRETILVQSLARFWLLHFCQLLVIVLQQFLPLSLFFNLDFFSLNQMLVTATLAERVHLL